MRKLILVLPVLAGVLWGSAGVFVRELNDFGMDGYTVLSTRMIVATGVPAYYHWIVQPFTIEN